MFTVLMTCFAQRFQVFSTMGKAYDITIELPPAYIANQKYSRSVARPVLFLGHQPEFHWVSMTRLPAEERASVLW